MILFFIIEIYNRKRFKLLYKGVYGGFGYDKRNEDCGLILDFIIIFQI